VLFQTLTDVERLPEWNDASDQVIDRPARLTPGANGTVEMHPSRPVGWNSGSTLQELDSERLRFSYRRVDADGNPSYAL
jgi:uncharacterized protein YndB with AHSA1/START domain